MSEMNGAVDEDESGPQDAVPDEYLTPLISEEEAQPLLLPRVGLRTLAYGAAAVWPFLGTYYEYTTLNDSGAQSNVCDESGCVGLGTEFAHNALGWLLPLSLVSLLVVWGMDRALQALGRWRRAHEPNDKPVSRIVLAGMFVGVCALALLVGILRGILINKYGR